jgi:hypothetical protein
MSYTPRSLGASPRAQKVRAQVMLDYTLGLGLALGIIGTELGYCGWKRRWLMATLNTVQTKLAAVLDGVAAVSAKIEALQAQVAAGGIVTQTELDALDGQAQAITDAVAAANAK